MKSLFGRIYVAFVSGLFAAALGAGLLTFVLLGPRTGVLPARMTGLASRIALEASGASLGLLDARDAGDAAAVQRQLDRLSEDLHMGVALYGADGTARAARGRGAPRPSPDTWRRVERGEVVIDRRAGPLCTFAPLERDGVFAGALALSPLSGGESGELVRPLLWLAGLLVLMAAASYPLARGMARRLERLTEGARRIAGGQLETRVEVKGRDEIAVLAKAMNDMAGRIQTLMRGQKELVASVSHELRSPLTRLGVSLEMAADGELAADARRKHLADVADDVADLGALVDDLLLASKLELADFPLVPEPLDLARLLAEVAERYERVRVACAAPLAVLGDVRLLRRVVTNLVDNALRASPESEPVEIATAARGGVAEIAVRDHGPGVPKGERERIFEPFYRPDPSRSRQSGGAGLGLAIARRIVERHGGTLTADAASGGGARFLLTLPLRQ